MALLVLYWNQVPSGWEKKKTFIAARKSSVSVTSKKINNRCSSSVSVLVAVNVRFYINGNQKEATNGCKQQVNTGTTLQPGVTVNPPPPPPPQQQQPATLVNTRKGHGDYREGGLKYTHLFLARRTTRVVRLHGYAPWERG